MYGYIYKTTNLLNGKIYVGQKKAKEMNKKYYGSGVLIKKAIEKYGKECFSVELIDFAMSADDLDFLEVKYIKELKAKHEYGNYNIADGGFLPRYDINNQPQWRQEEIKKKMSESLKIRGNMNLVNGVPNRKGVSLTEEHKRKLSLSHMGKNISEEQKKKMSESHKKYAEKNKEELTKRFDGYRENRRERVNVYVDGELKMSFDKMKDCVTYFSERGIGRRVIVDNIRNNEPICPEEKPKFMSNKRWEDRQRFKNYNLITE